MPIAARQIARTSAVPANSSGTQRIRENHAQHRHRSASRRSERRAGPEPRGFERRIAAHDVGPDQAQREKIDDEYRPQRRNAQHREPGTRTLPSPLLSNRPLKASASTLLPRRQSPSSCGTSASAPLNGLSLRPANPNRGFELMKMRATFGTSLSMMRAMRTVVDERAFRRKIASKCITTVDNAMTTP